MSALGTPSIPQTQFGDLTSSRVSGAAETPLPWMRGQRLLPGRFPAGAYARVEATDQNYNKGAPYFGSFIVLFCLGEADYLGTLMVNAIGWPPYKVHRASDNERYFDVTTAGHFNTDHLKRYDFKKTPPYGRFHWGSPSAQLDDRLLTGKLATPDWANATAQSHPPYRRIVHAEIAALNLGREAPNAQPNIEAVIGAHPRLPAWFGTQGTDYPPRAMTINGVNGILALADLLTSPRPIGFGWGAERFILSDWHSLAWELQQDKFYINPIIEKPTKLADILDLWTEYLDLVFYEDGQGRLGIIREPDNATTAIPAQVTQLDYHGDTRPHSLERAAADEIPEEVIVKTINPHTDQRKEVSQTYRFRAVTGAARGTTKSLDRTWLSSSHQGGEYARRYIAHARSRPLEGKRYRLTSAALRPDGTPLRRGDIVLSDLHVEGRDIYCRIIATEQGDEEDEVTLTLRSLRGQFPIPYVAPDQETPDLTQPDPTPLAAARIVQVPYGLHPTMPSLAILAQPGEPTSTTIEIYLSTDDSTYTENPIAEIPATAILCTLQGSIDPTTTTLSLSTNATNRDLLAGTTPLDQSANALLLIIDNEWIAPSTITPDATDPDLYHLTNTLRARIHTLPTTHTDQAPAWLIRQANIAILTNNLFQYQTTLYFKLRPRNIFQKALSFADPYFDTQPGKIPHTIDPATFPGPTITNLTLDPPATTLTQGDPLTIHATLTPGPIPIQAWTLDAILLDALQQETNTRLTLATSTPNPSTAPIAHLLTPTPGTWRYRLTAWDHRGPTTQHLATAHTDATTNPLPPAQNPSAQIPTGTTRIELTATRTSTAQETAIIRQWYATNLGETIQSPIILEHDISTHPINTPFTLHIEAKIGWYYTDITMRRQRTIYSTTTPFTPTNGGWLQVPLVAPTNLSADTTTPYQVTLHWTPTNAPQDEHIIEYWLDGSTRYIYIYAYASADANTHTIDIDQPGLYHYRIGTYLRSQPGATYSHPRETAPTFTTTPETPTNLQLAYISLDLYELTWTPPTRPDKLRDIFIEITNPDGDTLLDQWIVLPITTATKTFQLPHQDATATLRYLFPNGTQTTATTTYLV